MREEDREMSTVEKGTVIGEEGSAGTVIAVLAEGASSSVFEHVPRT